MSGPRSRSRRRSGHVAISLFAFVLAVATPATLYVASAADYGNFTLFGTVVAAVLGGIVYAVLAAINRARRERQSADVEYFKAIATLGPLAETILEASRETLRRTNDANHKLHDLSSDAAARQLLEQENSRRLVDADAKIATANDRLREANNRLAHVERELLAANNEKSRLTAEIAAMRAAIQNNAQAIVRLQVREGEAGAPP